MKISVAIPTYKRPALLSRCLDALYNQRFDKNKYEIIVVSDGHDDQTKKIIDRFRDIDLPRLHYYVLPEHKGPAAARNIGWQHAESKLIAFTDDDCIPEPFWLRKFYNAYLRVSKSKVAFAGHTIVPIPSDPTDYERNVANLEKAEFITANCACTRQALLTAGGFDEAFSMAWREDSDLQFKFIQHGIPIIPVEAKVTHPVRKVHWGISLKEERKGMFDALLYKKFPGLYRQKIQTTPPWRYYAMITCFLMCLTGLLLGVKVLAFAGFTGWIILEIAFIYRRLSPTRKTFDHISEMIITSMIIPFLSIYWRLYGVIKYKTSLF